MVFINSTGIIGQIIESGSRTLTGSETLTLILILIVFVVFTLMFRLPLIIGMLILTPFIIVLMAFNSALLVFGGIYILILAGILTKMFFFN